jgi:SAM-dependent methyltransferase
MICLDAGCGAGPVTRSLARRVGPGGRVVGIERDPVKLAAARAQTESAGLGNVEYREADVTTWSEPDTYDVVYGRFIVSHLRDRQGFTGRLREALRPGGTLLLEDIDFTGAFCYPPNAAFARYCELYRQVIDRRGGDANLGPRLYELCLGAGFRDLHVQAVQPMQCGTCEEKSISLSTMVNIADAVLAEGLASPAKVAETITELTAFTEDPESIIGCPRVFQVRARKH